MLVLGAGWGDRPGEGRVEGCEVERVWGRCSNSPVMLVLGAGWGDRPGEGRVEGCEVERVWGRCSNSPVMPVGGGGWGDRPGCGGGGGVRGGVVTLTSDARRRRRLRGPSRVGLVACLARKLSGRRRSAGSDNRLLMSYKKQTKHTVSYKAYAIQTVVDHSSFPNTMTIFEHAEKLQKSVKPPCHVNFKYLLSNTFQN